MMRILAWAISAVLAAAACSGAEWEFRYGHLSDQTDEWTAMGRVPGFRVQVADDDEGAVTWRDADDGRLRGWFLGGRRIRVPDGEAPALRVSLEYHTWCEMDAPLRRSGILQVFAATPAAWDSLARKAEEAQPFPSPEFLAGAVLLGVHPQGEDVVPWRAFGPVDFGAVPFLNPGEDVIVGFAWAAYHFCPEEGGVRNVEVTMRTAEEQAREFWESLNLDLPGLSGVAEAVRAGDLAAAESALAAYYRVRTGPVPGDPVASGDARTIAKADETLAHTYRLAGCPVYTFEGEIVWNADPFDYEQWAIALNRHTEWLHLAGAALATGNPAYAAEWDRQVLHWTRAMPVLIGRHWVQGPYNVPGKSPLSLDAGIRTGLSWFPAFEVFRRAPEVSDAALLAFVRSCRDHGRYLMKPENFKHGSNWGAMESNGLFHLGVLMPEFREAETWRRTALERLTGELDYQVYPDGAQTELAPGYHGVSLRNFLVSMRLARANGIPLPDTFVAGLARMFDYYLKIAMPDFRVPPLNDSGRGGIAGMFRDAVELFPEREEFAWALKEGGAGSPPAYLSTVMPYAGWVVMRSGWTPDAAYLLFDAGPFGTGHQHEDKLGVILYAHGRPLLTEAGVYAYDLSAWRRYVLSTRGHNTVRMDGKDQNCRRDRAQYRAEGPETYGFFENDAFVYARDTHTSGYGEPADASVHHRRRVLFVKPDVWVLVDDYAAADDAEHVAEAQFLLDAADAVVDAGSLAATSVPADAGGPRLALIPVGTDGLTVRVVKGQTEPEVVGFIPEGFENLRSAPAVLAATRFRGTGRAVTVLAPYAGEACPVTVTPRQAGPGETAFRLQRGGDTFDFRVDATVLACESAETPFAAAEPDPAARP